MKVLYEKKNFSVLKCDVWVLGKAKLFCFFINYIRVCFYIADFKSIKTLKVK